MNNELPPTSPVPNYRIGKFYLLEEIGRGSICSVFKAHDPVIDRDVAIKIMRDTPQSSERRKIENQFINEARSAGRLTHPNIVTIYDASIENGKAWVAMEYLSGMDLQTLLKLKKKLSFIEIARIGLQVAQALRYAHQHNVIHRDIKPANIFITDDGVCKVLDFGIARAPNRVSDEISGEQTLFHHNLLGTPNYMSPEQAAGHQVSSSTDIYSLGAVLFELTCGQTPYSHDEFHKLIHAIQTHPIPNPNKLNPETPEGLVKIITRCLQKKTELRYADAELLRAALERFIIREERRQKNGNTINPIKKIHAQYSISTLLILYLCLAVCIYVWYSLS